MLTDNQLNGTDSVKIFNKKLNGEDFLEGKGKIVKIHQGDKQGVYADIKFDGSDDVYARWVFSCDQ